MKWQERFLGISVGVLIVLFAATLSATDKITITGRVLPVTWDNNNHPTAAVIMSESNDYAIVDDAVGQGLFELMHMDVERWERGCGETIIEKATVKSPMEGGDNGPPLFLSW